MLICTGTNCSVLGQGRLIDFKTLLVRNVLEKNFNSRAISEKWGVNMVKRHVFATQKYPCVPIEFDEGGRRLVGGAKR